METDDISDNPELFLTHRPFERCVVGTQVAYPRNIIEHFQFCDDEVYSSDNDIVFAINQANNTEKDLEDPEILAPSITEVKSATSIVNISFSIENVDLNILDPY